MATAAALDKKAQELEAQGREVDSKASYRQSKDGLQSGPKSLCQGNFTPCVISRGSFASWRLDLLKAY